MGAPVRRGTGRFTQGFFQQVIWDRTYNAFLSLYYTLLARHNFELEAEAVQEGRMSALPAPVFAFFRDGLCRPCLATDVVRLQRTEMMSSTLKSKRPTEDHELI